MFPLETKTGSKYFDSNAPCGQKLDFNADAVNQCVTQMERPTICFLLLLLFVREFKRVLPLPNCNWNAIVDDWCCHPDPFAKKLLPRAEDCLLGDTFLLLAKDGGCAQTLTEEESPVGSEDSPDSKKPCRRLTLISCKSCSLVLGEAVAPGMSRSVHSNHKSSFYFYFFGLTRVFPFLCLPETLKLYITQVVVEPAVGDRELEASLNRSLFVEQTVAARLLGLSSSQSTFHFSVQTPDGKAFLLVWLLNSDSMTASVPETCVGDESSLGSPSLRASRALKLLYASCSDTGPQQKDIVDSWEANAIGHPVVLPLNVCEELLQVIDDSNSTLPASMRCMRSYEVAYLRL
uniref:E3 ubiquitin-protein ligase E3D n=1 Tax=Cyclopterus lumpus TaxID=8103 RepID=A0A8C2ZKZ5_CYCLU